MLIPQKFAGRLIFWTVLVVGSVYLVVVGTTNSRSRQMAMDAAESATERAADLVAARLEGVIADVEARTGFLADVVGYALPESDLEAILQSFVRGDERTWGAAIAFDPAWPSKASRKVLYLHRAARGSGRLISADLASSG